MKSLTAFVLFMALSPCALAASGDAAAGKDVFKRHCAICHGPDGAGGGPMAKAYNLTMPSLSSKEVQALTDSELHKVITEGKGKMKPVSGLTKAEVTNLIAFIRSLTKK